MTSEATESDYPMLRYQSLFVGQRVKLLAKTWGLKWAKEQYGDDFETAFVYGIIQEIEVVNKKRLASILFEDGATESHLLSIIHPVHQDPDSPPARAKRRKTTAPATTTVIPDTATASSTSVAPSSTTAPTTSSASTTPAPPKANRPSKYKWGDFVDSRATCTRVKHGAKPFGHSFTDRHLAKSSPYSIFVALLPEGYIATVLIPLTNSIASQQDPSWQPLTLGEFLRFLGYWTLMTLVELPERHMYWATKRSGLFPAFHVGQHGISKHRFDNILAHLTFSEANPADPLADIRGFMDAWNSNMAKTFSPSDLVCLDESMSMWTEKHSMPGWMFVDRKPTQTGQEFHTITCAKSNILYNVEPVEPRVQQTSKEYCDQFKAMTALCLRMTKDLHGSSRCVVADSAFSGPACTIALLEHGIHSIMAVKKKGMYYPADLPGADMKDHVDALPLFDAAYQTTIMQGHEVLFSGVHDYGGPCLLLSSCGSSLPSEASVLRYRDDGTPFQFHRPQVFQTYYDARHAVDDHNNLRQGSYALEYAWQTKHWSNRSFAFLLSVSLVNAFLVQRFSSTTTSVSHYNFRKQLTAELINNPYIVPSLPEPEVRMATRSSILPRHKLLQIPKYSTWHTSGWHKELKSEYPTRHCRMCQKDVRTYCACDPSRSVCDDCICEHVMQACITAH